MQVVSNGTSDSRTLFGLYHVGKGNERQSTNVARIERAIIRGCITTESHPVGKGFQLSSPFGGSLIVRRCASSGASAGNSDRGRLMRVVSYNFDGIGVQLAVRDGLGSVIKHGRNVVFRLDVSRDSWRVWLDYGVILYISFEYLRSGGRRQAR